MPDVNLESVRQAVQVFFRLIERGEINVREDNRLMVWLDDAEVGQVIQVLEEETGTLLLRGTDRVYITPQMDNRVFGYTNEELRGLLKVADNAELYTCYFIMLAILALFYRGEGYDIKSREFVEIEEIHQFIDTKIESLAQHEDISELDESYQWNFTVVVDKWQSMMAYDERKENLQSSRNNRMGFIRKVCSFLRDEGLVLEEEQRVIRTTEKMDRMVLGYYTARERKQAILDLVSALD